MGFNFRYLFMTGLVFCVAVASAEDVTETETLGQQEHQAALELQAAAPHLSGVTADVTLTSGPVVWRADEPRTSASLWGHRIVTEAGHGKIWYNNAWRWQRDDWFPGLHVHTSQEDYNTARMVNRWLLPYLRSAGAQVYPDRCPDEQTNEVICDIATITAPHSSTGSWNHGLAPDARSGSYTYAVATQGDTPSATAQVRATIPEDGYYGVTIWYPSFSRATDKAQFTVFDAAGNRHPFVVDQRRDAGQWVWLDRFYFEAGTEVLVVEVTNLSRVPPSTVLLDAVRLGGGMGTEDFGGGTSGVPRWQECAVNWTKYAGAPEFVWGAGLSGIHDYGTRFNYADWQNAELFMRLHTNGSSGHTGFGSEVYQFAADSAQLVRAGYVYPKIIQSIRNHYRANWTNRGVKANSVVPRPYPALLVELGFHDWLTDAEAMMDEDFRRVAMRGYYEGAVDYFTNKTGTYMPEPPENLALVNTGQGMIRAQWTTSTVGGSPDSYRVYYSTHPHCYKEYAETTAPLTSVEIGPLEPGEVYYFQFRAVNAGGLSLPSETLSAMTSADAQAKKVLLVNGFDRFDWDIDETDNHRNYCIQHATAVADAASSVGIEISIDSSSNEAVADGDLDLGVYALVDWMLGQESVSDETFSAAEQSAIEAWRQVAGVLLVSGSNIALDLGTNGTADDLVFLNDTLGVSLVEYRLEDVTTVTAALTSLFSGLDLQVEKSGAIYKLLGADAIRTTTNPPRRITTEIGYRHEGIIVAVYSTDQPQPLFTFTVPLEVIEGADARRALIERILPYMPDKASVGHWSLY